jgi:hypothetical protein
MTKNILEFANQNIKFYGAIGDGIHDDTEAIQAAIDAAELVGGTVYGPPGLYKITDSLIIDNPISFRGEGVSACWGGIDEAESRIIAVEIPTQSPYLSGTVILQTTAGKDAFQIKVKGQGVNLRDFGIRFADPIRFSDTGHGIYALPPLNEADQLPDFGMYDSAIDNVFVWGVDGDHYAFSLVNMVLLTMSNIRGYGGGGLEMHAHTNMTSPGNTVIIHPYFACFVGGTAHGIYIHATGNTWGCVLNTFIRPQVNFLTAPADWSVTPINVINQHNIVWDEKSLKLSLIAPDFETMISGDPWGGSSKSLDGFCLIPNGGGGWNQFITPNLTAGSEYIWIKDDNQQVVAGLYSDKILIKAPDGNFRQIKVSNDNTITASEYP